MRYGKIFFKFLALLKNGLKITLGSLVNEIREIIFQILSTSQKWP